MCKKAFWRRERDSNPRRSSRPSNDLANRPLQPLGYLSMTIDEVYSNRYHTEVKGSY
jgi:hypothetical protein